MSRKGAPTFLPRPPKDFVSTSSSCRERINEFFRLTLAHQRVSTSRVMDIWRTALPVLWLRQSLCRSSPSVFLFSLFLIRSVSLPSAVAFAIARGGRSSNMSLRLPLPGPRPLFPLRGALALRLTAQSAVTSAGHSPPVAARSAVERCEGEQWDEAEDATALPLPLRLLSPLTRSPAPHSAHCAHSAQ